VEKIDYNPEVFIFHIFRGKRDKYHTTKVHGINKGILRDFGGGIPLVSVKGRGGEFLY